MTVTLGNSGNTFELLAQISQLVIGVASLVVAAVAVRISKRTAELQNMYQKGAMRAHVMVDSFGLIDFDRSKPVRLRCRIRNFGATPSLRVRVEIDQRIVMVSDNSPIHTVTVPQAKGEIALGPSCDIFILADDAHGLLITESDWADIERGVKVARFVVAVEYADISGEARRTSVACELRAEPLRLNPQAPQLQYASRAFDIE